MTFANDISLKGLVSKIYKELIKLNTHKTNNPGKKWVEDMNTHFSKEDIEMANGHMKNAQHHSASGKRIQIKTTTRYHFTPVRMAKMNKSRNDRCWRGCRREPSYTVGGNASWYGPSGKQYGGPQR